ncbi:hypothetical protein [Marinicella sp. W31]|uniref:hypothetical protein n=1 Tax=Marinicella sp. W31 TaxID=3023713 RepID=UPI003757A185
MNLKKIFFSIQIIVSVTLYAQPSIAALCGGDIIFQSKFDASSNCSVWVPERDNNGFITIDSVSNYGTVTFENERSHEQILTDFPIGHNLPAVENRIFYDLYLDGYGGLPAESCLRRGYLMDINDPTTELCTANENKDLMRVWGNRNPDLQHVLLKNMEIKNAFRTYNVVDGTVVEQSRDLPHTDTIQIFFGGSAMEDPEWLVIQDTIIKNSDNSLMISGGTKFKGYVYQNLRTFCESWFLDDKHQRKVNDQQTFFPDDDPPTFGNCTNAMGASSEFPAKIWLIESYPGDSPAGRVGVKNQNETVFVIGTNWQTLRVTTRSSSNQVITHPNVKRYRFIEDAIADGNTAPPFISLSCAGWQTPPDNCESRQGFLNTAL